MHKFRRTPKDSPEKKFGDIPIFAGIDKIIRRANSSSKEFVVQTKNNTHEWPTLPLESDTVKQFLEQEQGNDDGLRMPESIPPVNIETWIAGGGIIADDDTSSNDMDLTE